MAKTTLYLDDESYQQLKWLAKGRGCAAAMLVREAVAEYVLRHPVKRIPKSIGAFRSRRRTLSERAEDLLAGMGR
ncbi:MAG: hypothetical protein HYZ58_00310 [Acidobacteria bacterium]|nr:hypothetical protein [Acidobacteriota bacterium]MBI3261574.1 hypothetical protein [Acidobacteriota bacterium]